MSCFFLLLAGIVGASYAGTWRQLYPASSPPVRMFAGVTYDEVLGRLIMFGGTPDFSRTVFFNDTWQWDGQNWTEVATPHRPGPRHSMFIAYDPDRQVVVLYGGAGNGFAWGDMWEFNGTDWSQVFPPSTPGPRSEGAMVYDRARSKMVLYGGHISGAG